MHSSRTDLGGLFDGGARGVGRADAVREAGDAELGVDGEIVAVGAGDGNNAGENSELHHGLLKRVAAQATNYQSVGGAINYARALSKSSPLIV